MKYGAVAYFSEPEPTAGVLLLSLGHLEYLGYHQVREGYTESQVVIEGPSGQSKMETENKSAKGLVCYLPMDMRLSYTKEASS